VRGFIRCIDVEHAGEVPRLIGDDAYGPPRKARKAGDDIFRIIGLHFEKIRGIHKPSDDIAYIVGFIRGIRHEGSKRIVDAVRIVADIYKGRILDIVLRQIGEQFSDRLYGRLLIGETEVCHARNFRVHASASQVFCAHFFTSHRLDDLRPGDEHVAGSLGHKHKIGERGGIDRASGTRTHDDGNLRDDTRRTGVPVKNLPVSRERIHAFLNTRPPRVIDADQWAADLHRQVHHLAYLRSVHLAEASADNRKILGKYAYVSAIDGPVPRHDSFARRIDLVHAELGGPVFDKCIQLHEGSRIEQHLDSLSSGHLAFFVLRSNPLRAAAGKHFRSSLFELPQFLFHKNHPYFITSS